MACASVNTQGGAAPASLTEALLLRTGMAIIIDEVRHQSPWQSGQLELEHAVRVRRFLRDDLQHVPVFNDFAFVIQSEDVNPGVVVVAWPVLEAVKNNKLTLGNGSLDLDAFAWPLAGHSLEISDETVLSRRNVWIMLSVDVADITFDGLEWSTLIEHELVKSDYIFLVAFQSVLQKSLPQRSQSRDGIRATTFTSKSKPASQLTPTAVMFG